MNTIDTSSAVAAGPMGQLLTDLIHLGRVHLVDQGHPSGFSFQAR
jgi:hypothetical protein